MSTESATVRAVVSFHLGGDILLERLRRKAEEVDETGGPPEGGYTLAQALAIVWMFDPKWLHVSGLLTGWVFEKAADADGVMTEVWG